MFKNLNSLVFLTAIVGTMLIVGSIIAPVSASVNPSPKTHPQSLSSTLSAQWWRWVLAIPPADNPLLEDNPCNIKQSGQFFFLVGTFGSGSAERTCTIPKDKSIFFPVVNFFQTLDKEPPFNTLAKVKEAVTENIDQAHNLHASVDGTNINLDNARAQSPLFPIRLGTDNIFGAPKDTYFALSDGYWVALKPLSVGEHEISFSGEGADDFSLEVVYHITVK